MSVGQTQSTPRAADQGTSLLTTQTDSSGQREPTHTSAKFTIPKQLKRPERKRFGSSKTPRIDPGKAVTINQKTVYFFDGPVLQKYDFLHKANEALNLSVELLKKKDDSQDVSDDDYFKLEQLIKDVKLEYQIENGRIPMNTPAKRKYNAALEQLDWALKQVF